MKKHELATLKIREWVENGTYPPGGKLPPMLKMGEMLGMTDQPVRKAVAKLAAEGLIDVVNGRGIFARDPNATRLRVMVFSSSERVGEPKPEVQIPTKDMCAGVVEACKERDVDLRFCSLVMYENDPKGFAEAYKSEDVDGVISWHAEGDELLDYIGDMHGYHRLVTISSSRDLSRGFNNVCAVFENAMNTAFDRAYELGHRRFAILYGSNLRTHHSHLERYRLFMKFCQDHQLTVPPSCMIETDGGALEGYRATLRLLDSGEPVTLIFVVTDLRAQGVLQALLDRGLTPGKDVSVIGFDGMSGIEDWNLTTIAVPRRKMGMKAVELLDSTIQNKRRREVIELECEAVFRSSLGPAPEC